MSNSAQPVSQPPAVAWSWAHLLVGAVYALPAAVACLYDPEIGIPFAVGVLPAALIGIAPQRRRRIAILIVGVLAGASLFLGGVLAHFPVVVTSVLLVGVVVGAALLASVVPAGRVVLVLCAPLVGAGLSYTDYASSAGTLLLLSLGAAYAWLVALLWPQRGAAQPAAPALPPRSVMLDYGIRMGVAAGLVYAIAAALDLDHPGWAPAACLLVARPQLDLLQTRGVGRVLSVVVGALAAPLLLRTDPADYVFAIVAVVVLAAATATEGSRWYITSAFTTFLVFLMLLNGHPEDTASKFDERVGETVLGVAAAFLFGWAVPVLRARMGRNG
ncbi:MAG TPA: FUSC family protein [Aldersonia sp.]